MQLKGETEVERRTLRGLDGEAALATRRIEDGADGSCCILVDLHSTFGIQGLVEAFVEAGCAGRLRIRRGERSRLGQSQEPGDHDGQQIHAHMLSDETRAARAARRRNEPGRVTPLRNAGLQDRTKIFDWNGA